MLRTFIAVTAPICEKAFAMCTFSLCRSASTILSRIAVSAGHRPVMTPNATMSTSAATIVLCPISNTGK